MTDTTALTPNQIKGKARFADGLRTVAGYIKAHRRPRVVWAAILDRAAFHLEDFARQATASAEREAGLREDQFRAGFAACFDAYSLRWEGYGSIADEHYIKIYLQRQAEALAETEPKL